MGRPLLAKAALELCAAAGVVDLQRRGGGIRELEQFQRHLKDYKIIVFDEVKNPVVLFNSRSQNTGTPLHLLLDVENEHYSVIINLVGAFCKAHFCSLCNTFSSQERTHVCERICPHCRGVGMCEKTGETIQCDNCLRVFVSDTCYARHSVTPFGEGSVCSHLRICSTCKTVLDLNYESGQNHRCGYPYCKACSDYKPFGHHCYMKPNKSKPPQRYMFIFYDFECTQNTPYVHKPTSYEHVPNVCCVQQVCNKCIYNPNIDEECSQCGVRTHSFTGPKSVEDFLKYLLVRRTFTPKIYAIAHNARSYDAVFLLREILARDEDIPPTVTMNGNKIIYMLFRHIVFLDSLNYLQVSLAKFAKMFDLDSGKGYYPHLFNTPEHWNYKGPMPAMHYFMPDHMQVEERRKFMEWYEQEAATCTSYNNQEELLKYCMQDVALLRQGCLLFRKEFLELTEVDCFTEAFTIASACNLAFRRKFLQKETIGLIPKVGYRTYSNQSRSGLKWLLYIQERDGVHLEIAGQPREKRLPNGMLADGYDEKTNTVYLYCGCFFHGYERDFPNRFSPIYKKGDSSDTMAARLEKTERQIKELEDLQYRVVTEWECNFEEFLHEHPEVNRRLDNHPLLIRAPIEIRDALYGGRVEAFKLHAKASKGKTIAYKDVCSLYPFVNKYAKYPIGHPEVLCGDHCPTGEELINMEGVAKVTILAPTKLYLPVLPFRCHGRLLFPLCCECATLLQNTPCTHTPEQRALTGTYVIDELRKAVEKGYKIVQVHEVWKYKVVQYNHETGEKGLFSEYVNLFLQVKQEASGWPKWCVTESQKDEYIDNYYRHEGIRLRKDHIHPNPGKRTVSKHCLNSLWGKFCQNEDKMQTSLIREPNELYEKLSAPGVYINNILFINNNSVWVNWRYHKEAIVPNNRVNVVLGVYTTTFARLQLYELLDSVGENAIYGDTDSLVYYDTKEVKLPTGDYLGDLTDELEEYGPGAYIQEFVSGGPKNYSYRVFSPHTNTHSDVCKVKGITLDFTNSQKVNFDVIKTLINNIRERCVEDEPITVVYPKKITRKRRLDIVSERLEKKYAVVFKKRMLNEETLNSYPFGFCQ